MKSTAANDNRRVKQTMLRYFKRVAIFRVNISQIEPSVTLSKWIRESNFAQVSYGS